MKPQCGSLIVAVVGLMTASGLLICLSRRDGASWVGPTATQSSIVSPPSRLVEPIRRRPPEGALVAAASPGAGRAATGTNRELGSGGWRARRASRMG
jgi:hypothetical protein